MLYFQVSPTANMIPITILTGFLGAGKTTILNEIVAQHPDTKFGLIINEFGAQGIDGQMVTAGDDEQIVELSNGCICCVVRQDLQEAALNLVKQGNVDYLIIETSGLAEPLPVAQTFAEETLGGKVMLDAVVCLIDAENYKVGMESFEVGVKQIYAADIIVINKINERSEANLDQVKTIIKQVNPHAAIIENRGELQTDMLIETKKWSLDRLMQQTATGEARSMKHETDEQSPMDHVHHEGEHHDHEHHHVDEVVFNTDKPIKAEKINQWISDKFPANAVRAKGILNIEIFPDQFGTFLFQMVGATRLLSPFVPQRADFDPDKSTLVIIGKELNESEIRRDLAEMVG